METAQKRPVSLTIIAWLQIIFSVIALIGVATMRSNPAAMKMMAQSPAPLVVNQLWSAVGAIVGLIIAYGIFKGQPWSRVLYVAWGIVEILVGLYISPAKVLLVVGLVFLIIFSIFLFSEKANDWFSARGLMLKREV